MMNNIRILMKVYKVKVFFTNNIFFWDIDIPISRFCEKLIFTLIKKNFINIV